MQEFAPFDIERMFLGDDFEFLLLLEIVFRTAVMYCSALILVRFIGKRGLGQLSPFEYLVVIAMGSAAGDPMFYPDVPLVHGIIVLAVIVLLQKGLISVSGHSEQVEHFVEGVPALLIKDGDVLEDVMKREGLAKDELFEKLRENEISHTGQVQYAFLEPSGVVSVFRAADGSQRKSGESTLPQDQIREALSSG